jgi:hypothetical protein
MMGKLTKAPSLLVIYDSHLVQLYYQFPIAMYDVAAMITLVLTDESLPVDKSRAATGGYFADGNLALSAPWLLVLKGKSKAGSHIILG